MNETIPTDPAWPALLWVGIYVVAVICVAACLPPLLAYARDVAGRRGTGVRR